MKGALPAQVSRTHDRNQTPHLAAFAVGTATLTPPVVLSLCHVTVFDHYGWLGAIATFGFVTAYILVVIAAAARMLRRRTLNVLSGLIAFATILFLGWAFVGSVNLDAPGPERWLAPVYFGIVFLGVGYGALSRKPGPPVLAPELDENP